MGHPTILMMRAPKSKESPNSPARVVASEFAFEAAEIAGPRRASGHLRTLETRWPRRARQPVAGHLEP